MTNKEICLILLIVICIALMSGCQDQFQSATAAETQDHTKDSGENISGSFRIGNDEYDKSYDGNDDDTDVYDGCKIDSEPITNERLEQWVGTYYFFESIPHSQNESAMMMEYTIVVYNENGEYYAIISIDGWMTLDRIKAKVVGGDKLIDLVFYEYLPESIVYMPIEEGTVLLSFERTSSDLLTHWRYIESFTPQNEESGKIYFYLVK